MGRGATPVSADTLGSLSFDLLSCGLDIASMGSGSAGLKTAKEGPELIIISEYQTIRSSEVTSPEKVGLVRVRVFLRFDLDSDSSALESFNCKVVPSLHMRPKSSN